uniref:RxLR effector protein n=1 Tax=Phytophthora agathidicida TaxID=1642459 RepID=A0A7G4WI33_9STRA|nr:PaRXLR44 [Phytophthora agathidicida]
MRLHHIALLVAVFVSAVSGTTTTTSLSTTGSQRDATTTRFLRINAAQDDEERAITTGFGFVDDIMQHIELTGWLKDSKRADEVISLLKLDDAGADIFKNPKWKVWVKYVTMLEKSDVDESMASALTYHFGGDKLATMLAAAQKSPSTAVKDIATKLETAQLNRWLTTASTPENIFTVLKLDKGADILFDSAALATWTSYLKLFNDKFPKKKTTMLRTFTKNYGEDGLIKLFVSAENANTPAATKFKNEVVEGWLDSMVYPSSIFKSLELDKAGDGLLTSPLLASWVQYMEAFNKNFPREKTTMIENFTKGYGDEKLASMLQVAKKASGTEELAKNLQIAQFKTWMLAGKTPDDIYKTVLKVESNTGTKADVWRAYYKAYVDEFPGKLFSFS